MSKSTGKKSASPDKGSPLLVGLLLGLIVGLGLAAGLAWYLMKSPTPFVNKDSVVVNKPQAAEQTKAAASEVVKQKAATPAPAASGVGDGKPRFEFYKVLTDKQDGAALPNQATGKSATPKSESAKPAVEAKNTETIKQTFYLQAGAFSNEPEAEKLKANLIMEGLEVSVLTVVSPEKGTLYKVRVGPYQGVNEMNNVRARLQLKGINSTPLRGQ